MSWTIYTIINLGGDLIEFLEKKKNNGELSINISRRNEIFETDVEQVLIRCQAPIPITLLISARDYNIIIPCLEVIRLTRIERTPLS